MTELCSLSGVICINGQAISGSFLMDGRFNTMICTTVLLYRNIVTRQMWFSDKLHYVFSEGVGCCHMPHRRQKCADWFVCWVVVNVFAVENCTLKT